MSRQDELVLKKHPSIKSNKKLMKESLSFVRMSVLRTPERKKRKAEQEREKHGEKESEKK